MRIEGVKRVSARDLRSKLAVEQTSWIPFSRKKYLDPFTVDVDKRRVEAYYATHGYFSARVSEAEVTPRQEEPESVDVRLVIYEGLETKVAATTVTGLDHLTDKELKLKERVLRTLPVGARFDHPTYLAERSRLETRLRALGYPWSEVKGSVEVDRARRTAVIKIDALPGPWTRFGTATVVGTRLIDPRLVLIHAQVPTAQPFDDKVLDEVRGRVYSLGVFSSVKVDYRKNPTRSDLVDVVITVHEGPFHELRLGAGFTFESTRYDLHLSGQYIKNNFFGGLRTLKLRLEPGWVFLVNPSAIGAPSGGPTNGPALKAEATFRQPDLFYPLVEFKWSVGYDVGIDYAYQYHGPRTALGLMRPFWHNRLLLGVSYNFNLLLFFNAVPSFQDNPAAAAQLFGYTSPYRVGWLQQDLVLDLRDKPLSPHSGAYLSAVVEEGGTYAGGAFTYQKILPELRLYAPLGRRVTVAGRLEFGQLFAERSELGSPITRRFYMGGPDSHRGFNYNRLALQVPIGRPGAANLPVGGDQILLMQGEVRADLVRLFGNWFGITGFFDAGDVSAPSTSGDLAAVLRDANGGFGVCYNGHTPRLPTSVELKHLHLAAGGGLRYHTLIGTIRADVGVRLNRTRNCESDDTPNPDPVRGGGPVATFHLSIGESF